MVYLPTADAPRRALVKRQIEVGPITIDRIVGSRYDWRDGDWTVRPAAVGPADERPDLEAEGSQAEAEARLRDYHITQVEPQGDDARRRA